MSSDEVFGEYLKSLDDNDPSKRECPKCGKFNVKNEDSVIINCACGFMYCFQHGGAHHPDAESCKEYSDKLAKEQDSIVRSMKHSRLCPGKYNWLHDFHENCVLRM